MNPSRNLIPSADAMDWAAMRLVSGMGMTTSMSWSGHSRRILSASRSGATERRAWVSIRPSPSSHETVEPSWNKEFIHG